MGSRCRQSAADGLGTAVANAGKMFGPERVVIAFTPEMNLAALTARSEQVFRRQYGYSATPPPDLELAATGPSDHASGAAYTVLAQLFTARTSDAGTDGAGASRHVRMRPSRRERPRRRPCQTAARTGSVGSTRTRDVAMARLRRRPAEGAKQVRRLLYRTRRPGLRRSAGRGTGLNSRE